MTITIRQDLIEDIESVLHEDENVLSFVLTTLKSQVEYRKVQIDYLQKAIEAAQVARETGIYYTHEEVMDRLRRILEDAKRTCVNKK